MIGDHKTARNLVAIEAVHYGLDTDTAARLAGRLEGMGRLRDDTELNRIRRELEELLKVSDKAANNTPADDYENGQGNGIMQMGNQIARILYQEEA